ncbi:MAG: C13 family peptidase [Bacteroidales bacterium]|jgi:hypothetical protein|nr:C13 family peptidase [Bacteroidales bacterium]
MKISIKSFEKKQKGAVLALSVLDARKMMSRLVLKSLVIALIGVCFSCDDTISDRDISLKNIVVSQCEDNTRSSDDSVNEYIKFSAVNNATLKIEQRLYFNCCSENIDVMVNSEDNTITISITDTDGGCNCVCPSLVSCEIGNLQLDNTYRFVFYRNTLEYYTYDLLFTNHTDIEIPLHEAPPSNLPPVLTQSQQEAYDILKQTVLKGDTTNIHLYISKDMIKSESVINTLHADIVSPDFTSWMFFIDDLPWQNWSHPARFVFVGSNGQIEIIPYSYPPDFDTMKNMDVLIQITYPITEDVHKKMIESISKIPSRSLNTSQNEYAVIISGGADRYNNYERYWNDCAAIYTTLINVYNYDRSHIYVIMSDGTNPTADRLKLNGTFDSSPLDLNGDGTNDIQYAATKANITTVFNTLSQIMTNQDNLFIFTMDHGGQNSGQSVYLNLWNETIQDTQFAAEVNKVNAKSINIVMGQCNSGGFIDNLARNNRVIATACTTSQNSYAMQNLLYDEFVFHWISAVAGRTPLGAIVNADTNSDGLISAQEAFTYANNNDTRPETPQYSSTPLSTGQLLTLKGGNFPPVISGSKNVCSSATFSANNWQSGYYWVKSNSLVNISNTSSSSVTISRANSSSYGECSVSVKNSSGTTLVTYSFWVGLPTLSAAFPLSDEGLVGIPVEVMLMSYYPQYHGISMEAYKGSGDTYYGYGSGGSRYIQFEEPGNYTVMTYTTTNCGSSPPLHHYNFHVYGYSMSFNSKSNELEIAIDDGDAGKSLASSNFTVTISDSNKASRSQRSYSGSNFKVPVSSLPDGTYTVSISNGKISKTTELVIKR